VSKKEASNRGFYKTEKENQKLTLKQKELKGWISIGGRKHFRGECY
jgi:hypothetical protein